jgi:uncharacterized protein involved in oxidation of intracellular sulfur
MRLRHIHGDAWSVKTLVVLNDPPYGTERSYNGLRLANALAKREGEQVRSSSLPMRSGARWPATGRRTATTTWSGSSLRPPGTTLRSVSVAVAWTRVDEGALVEGARRSSLDELADWTLWADKVVSF